MSLLEPNNRASYLRAMGIQTWASREQASVDMIDEVAAPARKKLVEVDINVKSTISEIDPSQLDWPALQSAVTSCTACALHESRTKTVFGVGDYNAKVMVIGEAPGADEDQQGEPFVGPVGYLLNNMLLAIGYKREQVYIANILKCRPPEDRDPQPEEVSQCEGYLKRQIAMVKPVVILAVGRIAAQNLMKVETPIGKMRGKPYQYADTPVVVTYHPAYLLRKPSEKVKSWDDLRYALSIIHAAEHSAETITEMNSEEMDSSI